MPEFNSFRGILGGSDGNESACNAGNLGSILGSGWSPGEGNDILGGSKITADGDCSHEIKKMLTPWKESYDQPR